MGDRHQRNKKRKFPWTNSEANSRKGGENKIGATIGTTLADLHSAAITVEEMLALSGYHPDQKVIEAIKATKDEVYKELARCLRVEGHESLMEANVNDLVLFIIIPIIDEFNQRTRTGRKNVQLFRERQLMAEGGDPGGYEEFVMVDRIAVDGIGEKYILIIEAKRESLGAAMNQCLLAMKDMGDKNQGSVVYGFVTTGNSWRMLRYDGASFIMTDKIEAIFDTMGRRKERWINDFSVIVDCVYAALGDGSVARKDLVVV